MTKQITQEKKSKQNPLNIQNVLMVILNNLNLFDENIEEIKEIYELLHNSSFYILRDIFKEALNFYETNNKFPSPTWLQSSVVKHLIIKTTSPYSEDMLIDLKRNLKYDKTINEARIALDNSDADTASQLLSKLATATKLSTELYSFRSYLDKYIKQSQVSFGISSGIKELDALTYGVHYQTMNVVGASSGAGKTTLGVSFVYNAVINEKKNFIYFSFEISKEQLASSFISRHSKEMSIVDSKFQKIKASDLKIFKENRLDILELVLDDWIDKTENKLFIITQEDFINGVNPVEIERMIKRVNDICEARGEKLDGFVFDYIQLLKHHKPTGLRDEKETLNYYVRYFQSLCVNFGEFGLIGIILAQLNRIGGETLNKNKDASLFTFAEANELERSAHWAIILHATDDMKLAGNLNFHLVKNRIGTPKSKPTTVYVDYPYYQVGIVDMKKEVLNVDSLQEIQVVDEMLNSEEFLRELGEGL